MGKEPHKGPNTYTQILHSVPNDTPSFPTYFMLLCHKIHLFQKLLARSCAISAIIRYFCELKRKNNEYSYRKI